jgi:hypothetical protein
MIKIMTEHEEKVIAVLRRSRKAFVIEYTCGLILLIFLAVFFFYEIPLNTVVRNSDTRDISDVFSV